jgi:hypothetical protein
METLANLESFVSSATETGSFSTTARRLSLTPARGRRWLEQLSSGAVTDAQQLAKRDRCTVRHVNLTLSLAFLAPQLVKAAVEGRLPRGINIERLRDPDAEWSRQFQELGLDQHQAICSACESEIKVGGSSQEGTAQHGLSSPKTWVTDRT